MSRCAGGNAKWKRFYVSPGNSIRANNIDCKTGSDRGTIVQAAELQVF